MSDTRLDRPVHNTIIGHGPDDPQTLEGIIGGVDASERLILSRDELAGGLQRLIDRGRIIEITKHRFCEAPEADTTRAFSGLTAGEHEAAVAQYKQRFRELLDASDDADHHAGHNLGGADQFVWQKLVLRWATPDDRSPTDEDEDNANALAAVVEPLITESGLGEVNGFESGSGEIDILIFGRATDSDVDQIYDLLAPAFRAFPCPPGSRMIRHYNERHEELESDIVPAATG